MKNKKVIVFGGSGFVGSAVADELTKQLQLDKKKCFELITNLKKTI